MRRSPVRVREVAQKEQKKRPESLFFVYYLRTEPLELLEPLERELLPPPE